jgi:chromosomal replication initiation ATPase DnaA
MSANLLFLYGPSGSGKTRMLQTIAESIGEVQDTLMVGSERVVDEMTQSVTSRDFTGVFDRYAHIANLLIDNLWILQSRPSAAKEIGRLIKARMAQGNLTVLASDLRREDVMRIFPAIGDCLKEESAIQLRLIQAGSGAIEQRYPGPK